MFLNKKMTSENEINLIVLTAANIKKECSFYFKFVPYNHVPVGDRNITVPFKNHT